MTLDYVLRPQSSESWHGSHRGRRGDACSSPSVTEEYDHGRRTTTVALAYTGDYCFGGTRVDCQDTNCTPWPRLAHTLWNRACSERSPPLKVRSNSTKPVIMARQP
jgi:hypothetical protein